MKNIVVIGSDHNGIALKAKIKTFLSSKGHSCIDIGPYEPGEKVDYTDYAKTVGTIVHNQEAERGILVCGTGVGMSIAVNRFPRVRASLVHSLDVASKTREHNDANVLCLGAWVNSDEQNLAILETWFAEKFGEGRHVKRVEKMTPHDKEKIVFTNGVFDLLHPGHIDLLKFAKSLGGRLIVGINSDRAVKILKGPDRPINNETARKTILENLGFVDQVVIFDDTKTERLVRELSPHILVKGAEWTAEEVRKRDRVPAHIEIKVFPLLMETSSAKYSTTTLIQRISNKKTPPPTPKRTRKFSRKKLPKKKR